MNIKLFQKPYVIRRYEQQVISDDAYASQSYRDFVTRLNVQPLSNEELLALPEGERTVMRRKAFGKDLLRSADEAAGTLGDRLFYQDRWYVCISSIKWNGTILRHFYSEFVVLPSAEQDPPPEVMPK